MRSTAEEHTNFHDPAMETRTFRIVPVRRGAEIEIISVIEKQTHFQNSRRNYSCDGEDDAMVIATPISSNVLNKYNRNLNEINYPDIGHRVDTREDDSSPPTTLRSHNRNSHISPKNAKVQHKHRKTQKVFTETEKRIAQLRSAGLSISTKGLSSSPAKPKFQEDEEEERDTPPPPPPTRTGNRDDVFTYHEGSAQAFPFRKSSALQALLEKDSMQQQRFLDSSPSQVVFGSIKSKRSRKSTTFPSKSSPSFAKLATNLPVDPIIAARPSYGRLRVSLKKYPDPVAFGWTFVGSCQESKVEFFEKNCIEGRVVLEFHYTTGTVKATLKHPPRGESLLAYCMGELASNIYRKILLDPLGCSERKKVLTPTDEIRIS